MEPIQQELEALRLNAGEVQVDADGRRTRFAQLTFARDIFSMSKIEPRLVVDERRLIHKSCHHL